MELVVNGYQHRIPDGEREEHVTKDGPFCVCAPRVINLPLVIADREGYAQVIQHNSKPLRRQLGILR